jgi:hypothetical protein
MGGFGDSPGCHCGASGEISEIDVYQFFAYRVSSGVCIEEAEGRRTGEYGARSPEPEGRFVFVAEDAGGLFEDAVEAEETIGFVLLQTAFGPAAQGGALGDPDESEDCGGSYGELRAQTVNFGEWK